MSLPIRQLPSGTFTFKDGVEMPIRGLSRAEALQLRELGDDVISVEVFCIECATGTGSDEAKAWHATAPQGDVEDLVNAIADLSGLNPDVGKADAGALPSATLTELTTSLQRILDALSQKSEG